MRYALIGCGRISTNHLIAATTSQLDIVAICDITISRAVSQVHKLGLDPFKVELYDDYKELLVNAKPELVAIATESGKHADIALDCIAAGCHVIIEKPIALSIADANAIISAANDAGVLVCVNHQNRFNNSIQEIRRAIDSNRFGKLLYATAHIRWSRNYAYYKDAAWRGTWEQDGGALMNQCIHDIDLLRWLMGNEIDTVIGMTDQLVHPYIQTEDLGLALVRFKNGAYGIIEGTTNVYPCNLEETLYIFGEKGTAKAGGEALNRIEEWKFGDCFDDETTIMQRCSEYPPNVYGFGHTKLYRNVIAAIKGKERLLVDGEAGKNALELVLAIYESAAYGQPVRLPLENCSTMDFVGRFDI